MRRLLLPVRCHHAAPEDVIPYDITHTTVTLRCSKCRNSVETRTGGRWNTPITDAIARVDAIAKRNGWNLTGQATCPNH